MKKYLLLFISTIHCLFAFTDAVSLKNFNAEASAMIINYYYDEPSVMNIQGAPFGIAASGGYTHKILQDISIKHVVKGSYAIGIDSRYNGGITSTSSDGNTTTTPHSTTSQDVFYQFSYTIGTVFLQLPKYHDLMYFGIGKRYVDNKLDGAGSYRREQSYTYLPLGYEGNYRITKNLSLQFGLELYIFLKGQNISHMKELGYGENAIFEQDDGSGYTIHIGTKYHIDDSYIFARLSLQGWTIADSTSYGLFNGVDTKYYYEPANTTRQFYLNVGVGF